MGVVRRDGKWRLLKDRDGVYEIQERNQLRARIITAEYESQGMMENIQMDPMTPTIEVRDFSEAEQEFERYIEDAESGGFGLL